MADLSLKTRIIYLKGVGAETEKLLAQERGLHTVQDLLEFYPYRYIDRSEYHKISQLTETMAEVQIKGIMGAVQESGIGRKRRFTATFRDDIGTMQLIWFKTSDWLYNLLKTLQGEPIVIFGKINTFKNQFSMPHPEMEKWEEHQQKKIGMIGMYSLSEKMMKSNIHQRKMQEWLLEIFKQNISIEENLSPQIIQQFQLIGRKEAFQKIHFPKNIHELETARNRIKFEEFFFLNLGMIHKKIIRQHKNKGIAFEEVGEHFNDFYQNHLPFQLTNAQKRVIKEIRRDLKRPVQMNRLLQGDVGSGKTIVALLCMLLAIDNGTQTCLMAPTEVLAQQHFEGISELLKDTALKVSIITGSTPQKVRVPILEKLKNGELPIIIGTHALLEKVVEFKQLGLAIIDEQHKFGVAQRAKLWKKNKIPPHVLVMTATPIPRTLAMTAYGDLDISIIDEMPKGRKPIKTIHYRESMRLKLFHFMKNEIKKGRQIYMVYPLIEESQTLELKNLMEGYESITRYFPAPEYAVSIVNGKMKPANKQYEMDRFVKGETQIMVATTVIEVGVNVPNASVMVIENAERFGLSQLHQLRGRVGRGSEQSYCVLMSEDQLTDQAFKRIQTMCSTNDGFRIAEVDMELRGPGDLLGTQQSGVLNFKMAKLTQDQGVLRAARHAAEQLLLEDPNLNLPEHQSIKKYYQEEHADKVAWGQIS